MTLPKRVLIRELGPREGFQTLLQVVPTSSKLRLIELLSLCGLEEIEVASFVRPDKVPQMADAEAIVAALPPHPTLRFSALYLNPQGFERAEASQKLANQGWIYLSASETFLNRNSNTSTDATLESIPDWISLFGRHRKNLHGVMISAAFGCNYEGRISPECVVRLLERAMKRFSDLGVLPVEISLADTMGWGTPGKVKSLIEVVRQKFSPREISLHLHDTRGSGMANVYAGLEVGVSKFDCSIGGMGGCPFAKGAAGNVPTEDVAFLCHELGIETGLSLEHLVTAARYAESVVGMPLPGKLYKSWSSS